ncbi:hypothetical protein EOI86_15670 [Hwanghaeella grinnelliae]|uniref:Uncharacterized protein n=1 Tax=Hwanghaeella grinnelliae TaxID=2500179 RepID=A0A437QQ21_9PROT|nr:hypothetical protein [Hwanghaeella grinnelliae]RVU36618.1 hypothetical protein EOI86_15670 [Hwanghaeella grinnelliae]
MSYETAGKAETRRALKRGRKAFAIKSGLILAGIVALGLTAGCGKKDDPQAPGPNPTYPKTYPTS